MTTIVRRRKLGMSSLKGITGASQRGITFANNYEHIPHDDVYIRWGCTSNVPNKDAKIINSAKSIHRISDKAGFRQDLQGLNLCPTTWFSLRDWVEDMCPLPVIVRSKTHAQGRGLWMCYVPEQVEAACRKAGPGYYINEYVPKKQEFRVFIHQGRVVWVAEKTPDNPDAIAWNVAKGGRFDNVRWGNWNLEVIKVALAAWAVSKAHFAGIDVMVGNGGRAYVIEANSAPSQTSPYRQSCVAKAFDYMVEHEQYEREVFNPHVPILSWKDAIHPALWNRAA